MYYDVMTNRNIIKVSYFNVNDKKNSILENAKYQDNSVVGGLEAMENLTNKIKNDISKKDQRNNIDCSINFPDNKKY